MNTYTDGNVTVTALKYEDNRRGAYHAFNFINHMPLESLDVPPYAVEYILNNSGITMPNKQKAFDGDYIINDENDEFSVLKSDAFHNKYMLVETYEVTYGNPSRS